MGERALIQLTDGTDVSPVLYLHWGGRQVADILRRTQRRMRTRGADLEYTFARLVQEAIGDDDGCLSFGVWNLTTPLTADYSHGDAGCFLVDISVCTSWAVRCFGGYGLSLDGSEEVGADRVKILTLPVPA